MATEKKRGGARPGAGRPSGWRKPEEERVREIAVQLREAQIDHARSLGEGNLSAGIRLLVDASISLGASMQRTTEAAIHAGRALEKLADAAQGVEVKTARQRRRGGKARVVIIGGSKDEASPRTR